MDERSLQLDAIERIVRFGVRPDRDAVRAAGRILLRLSLDAEADDAIKRVLTAVAERVEILLGGVVPLGDAEAMRTLELLLADLSTLRLAYQRHDGTPNTDDR